MTIEDAEKRLQDDEVAKLKEELKEAREIIQIVADGRRLAVTAMINGTKDIEFPDWMKRARAFLDKAGK